MSFHRRLKIQRVNSLLPGPPIRKVPFIINLRLLIGQKNSLLPYPKGSQNLIAAACLCRQFLSNKEGYLVLL